jgi:pSer/pThr/pTyr-binding forkhead associated (FHA) protein
MAALLVTDGPANGQTFALEQHRLVMVGRDAQCTFQIVDTQMSRRHMQIRFDADAGRHCAIDFGSSNGVHVNDNRIEEETALEDGDRIRLGSTTLVYSVDDSPNAQRVWEMLRRHGQGSLQTSAD